MRGLEKEFRGRINFTYVNILKPENEPYLEEFGFGTTPELYLVDSDGKVVGFWDEVASADDFRAVFEAMLGQ